VSPPPFLAEQGYVWFRAGSVEIHIGPDEEFRPASMGHPAIQVDGLDELAARAQDAGNAVRFDERLPGFRRFFVMDPFGNRLEFMQASD
jgi:catechol 2,3-dioxygenase-like lactoylglutathione lyase family enzyme